MIMYYTSVCRAKILYTVSMGISIWDRFWDCAFIAKIFPMQKLHHDSGMKAYYYKSGKLQLHVTGWWHNHQTAFLCVIYSISIKFKYLRNRCWINESVIWLKYRCSNACDCMNSIIFQKSGILKHRDHDKCVESGSDGGLTLQQCSYQNPQQQWVVNEVYAWKH